VLESVTYERFCYRRDESFASKGYQQGQKL